MNVPTIGQGLGSTQVLARPQTERPEALPSDGPGSVTPIDSAHTRNVDTATFTRIGWFDANGDGQIDERSAFAGGDATLLLPHSVVAPTFSHRVSASERDEVKPVTHDDHTDAPAENGAAAPAPAAQQPAPVVDVRTRQAIDAYQRYGDLSEPAPTERAVA